MVSLPSEVSSCDFARNYTGFGALAGIHVRVGHKTRGFGRFSRFLGPDAKRRAVRRGVETLINAWFSRFLGPYAKRRAI